MLRLLDGCINLYANRKVQTCQFWVMGNGNVDHIMIPCKYSRGVAFHWNELLEGLSILIKSCKP